MVDIVKILSKDIYNDFIIEPNRKIQKNVIERKLSNTINFSKIKERFLIF